MQQITTVDPAIETASDEGRAFAADLAPVAPGGGSLPNAPTVAAAMPFAARFQGILIVVMLTGMVLIGQQVDKSLYQVGLPLLVVAAFLQIAFGNIPATAGFARSLRLLGVSWLIIIAVFALAILLAPVMIDASR